MNKVLTSDLWEEVATLAKKAKRRQVAIAYVTQDLVEFRKGDVLVVNASTATISGGETDAQLLKTLQQREVSLYHCPDLHAKVILLDDTAVIGSANMSNSSKNDLVEAAVMTDQESIVAGVASLIEQLKEQSDELSPEHIAKLCKIKVKRRGGSNSPSKRKTRIRKLGNQTWLIGVRELVRTPPLAEQAMIAAAAEELDTPEDELAWIRWPSKDRLAKECREGDRIIQIRRSSKAKRPSYVWRSMPVLLKQPTEKWTRFYLGDRSEDGVDLRWGQFKQLMEQLGYPRKLGPGIVQLVEADMAEAISRAWKKAANL